MGIVHERRGECALAAEELGLALQISEDIGDIAGQAQAHNGLGAVHRHECRWAEAMAAHERARALATGIGDSYEQARALSGVAHVLRATGRPGRARQHWIEALGFFDELGVPEAAEVRALLGS